MNSSIQFTSPTRQELVRGKSAALLKDSARTTTLILTSKPQTDSALIFTPGDPYMYFSDAS